MSSIHTQRFEADTEGSQFTLSFDRADQAGAPESIATLPAPFSVTMPEADSAFSRSNDTGEIVVAWDNQSDDRVNVTVHGVIVLHPILHLMRRIRQATPFPYRTLKTMNTTRSVLAQPRSQ